MRTNQKQIIMNTTLDIGTELFREIGYLVDDENSLKKMLAYARSSPKRPPAACMAKGLTRLNEPG